MLFYKQKYTMPFRPKVLLLHLQNEFIRNFDSIFPFGCIVSFIALIYVLWKYTAYNHTTITEYHDVPYMSNDHESCLLLNSTTTQCYKYGIEYYDTTRTIYAMVWSLLMLSIILGMEMLCIGFATEMFAETDIRQNNRNVNPYVGFGFLVWIKFVVGMQMLSLNFQHDEPNYTYFINDIPKIGRFNIVCKPNGTVNECVALKNHFVAFLLVYMMGSAITLLCSIPILFLLKIIFSGFWKIVEEWNESVKRYNELDAKME